MRKKKIRKLLNLAHNMIGEGKISEALEFLNSLEPVDKYTKRQKTIFYTLKSKIYDFLGDDSKAYETAEKAIEFTKIIDRCIEVVDTFLNMAHILAFKGKNIESMTLLEESSDILKNLTKISEKDRKQRLGLIYLYKGHNYRYLGESMKAIEFLKDSIDILEKEGSQASLAYAYSYYGNMNVFIGEYIEGLNYIAKSQKICENKESAQYNYPKLRNIFGIGGIHGNKGELQQAVDHTKKGVSLARKYNNLRLTLVGLNNLGDFYRELGEWDQAIKILKEALPIAENIGLILELYFILDNFFHVYLNMGDLTSAQQIFHKIEQYREKQKENKQLNLFYRSNRAVLLKISKRARDLGVAQEIFKTIAQEEVVHIRFTQGAILNLCEMLLDEFKETKNVKALEEFSPLLKRLQEVAEKQHIYSILAETYVLDAKLSMIHFNLKKARHLLTQAQQIAERYGLKLLAIKISNEHDNLLQNLEVWEQMKKENVPMSDRLEKIDLNDQILTMLKKKPAEIPDTSPETPILIIIMANTGIPLYTKIFSKEWKVKEELFGGFLSAFNSFSDEIFSEGLNRANFGKFTILMADMPPFRSCYVFKGQSFLAQQKFAQFNETLYDSEPMWKKLTSANRTGQVIKDGASGGLEQLVQTIF